MTDPLNERKIARLGDTVEFIQVSISKALVDHIETILKKHPEYGYKNVSDFLEDTVTGSLKKIRRIIYIYGIALVSISALLGSIIIFGF